METTAPVRNHKRVSTVQPQNHCGDVLATVLPGVFDACTRKWLQAVGDIFLVQATQEYAGKSLQLYNKIQSAKSRLPRCVVIPSERSTSAVQLQSGDISWGAFLQHAVSHPSEVLAFQPAYMAPDAIMNVLFSSGTTGAPKAIPWTHITPLRCAPSSALQCMMQFFMTTKLCLLEARFVREYLSE